MQIYLHQTHHTIGDFEEIFTYIKENSRDSHELHIFPELFLTGYPLQDLCLQKAFYANYLTFIEKLEKWALKEKGSWCMLLGGLNYEFDQDGLPLKIENCLFSMEPGKKLQKLYTKRLLPNYDIFDEQKYFTKGKKNVIWNYQGKQIALMICEDMWFSSHHEEDPVDELYQQVTSENIDLDLIINVSASPFFLGKVNERLQIAKKLSLTLGAPFIYVNKVGAEDEILFDGDSFVVSGEEIVLRLKRFSRDLRKINFPERIERKPAAGKKMVVNTWEGLFSADLRNTKDGQRLPELSHDDCQQLFDAIKLGVDDYARKCGFNKFLVALSGGIDSSLVLTLLRLFYPDGDIEAIYMPGMFSRPVSHDLSRKLCKNLGIPMKTFGIKFLHSMLRNNFRDHFKTPLEGLSDENIQSRLRGTLLYGRSNQTGAMVLNTSNKSELAVGYSTLYGDSVGAISPLGDLYKSEVFQLSHFLNERFGDILPKEIIEREPSAELRKDQVDSESLPPYPVLDAILEGILSYRLSVSDLIEKGFSKDDVDKVFDLYRKSEFKRKQFAPIIKLKSKSFGFGYRIPICKKY